MNTAPQEPQILGRLVSAATARTFSYLYDQPAGRTKREIATDLGLSLPTVYAALSALQEMGLVAEGPARPSAGGRPAATFIVNAGGAHAVGISITGTLVRGVVCDLMGNEVVKHEERRSVHGSLDELRQVIEENIASATSDMRELGITLAVAGVTIPAIIPPESEMVLNASELGLEAFETSRITAGLPLPTILLNDASCGGFAEVTGTGRNAEADDADPSHTSMAFLSLEDGVGGAVLIEGAPFAGTTGRSGEFGHICVEPGGRPCSCGKRGCLQTYCSARILTDAGEGSLDAFFQALGAGERGACAVWDDFASHLARAIATLRLTLDCDVVLGGMLAPYLAMRLDDVRERTLELLPFDESADFVRIARHPRFGVPLGAARAALAHLQRRG